MSIISKSTMMRILTRLLVLLIISKSISLALLWFLPSNGVSLSQSINTAPKYHRYTLKNMIEKSKRTAEVKTNLPNTPIVSATPISNMILKGLYKTSKGGFVIVALKSSANKTEVIGIGESFSGFRLKEIHHSEAIFERGGQNYTLKMVVKEDKNYRRALKPAQNSNNLSDDAPHEVKRADIEYYAKNFRQIWKDISIIELKENGKLKGFKVTRIKRGTPFEQLGLRKGDIIIKANNVVLKSYKDAIEIYKNLDKLQAVEITVLRNNEEKELIYEIY